MTNEEIAKLAWDDTDVERFIAFCGERGVWFSLIEGSEYYDPKDALDIHGAIEAMSGDAAHQILTHRRDLACWLRGLRGEARKAAVAEARSEARQASAPFMGEIAEGLPPSADVRVGGIPIDKLPDDEERGPPQ